MSPYIIIALFAGLPLLFGLLLRVHSSALFLSIVSGYLLDLYVGDTAGLVARSFIANSQTPTFAKVIVFVLPIILTMWIMRKSLGGSQLVIHFLPLIGCALLVLVLGLPLLTPATQNVVYGSFPGNLVKQMSDAIVGIAVGLQLLLMWVTARPKPPAHKRHR